MQEVLAFLTSGFGIGFGVCLTLAMGYIVYALIILALSTE